MNDESKHAAQSFSERMYALFMRCYPREFREQYGEELQEFYRDQLREARTQSGAAGVARLWTRAARDIIATAVVQHIETLKARRPVPVHSQQSPTIRRDSMLTTIAQDFRYAIRTLRKNPVFALVAIAVVALGTGAVSTIFSVGNSIILQSVPGVRRASDVVNIQRTGEKGDGSLSASYTYYEDLANHSKRMNGIAAWSLLQMTVSSGAEGVNSLGNIVSGNYFEVLGVTPALGRFFAGDEKSVQDAFPVAVISNEFWQRQFAGDSGIVGKQLLINGTRFNVIGVAPRKFSGLYPVLRTDVWVPLMMQRAVRRGGDLLSNGNAAWLELFGRVADGSTISAAQMELAAITKQRSASATEPRFMADFASARLTRISGLPAEATLAVLSFFLVLLVVSGLVLLIASVNVASMLLARAVQRRREIALRIALGAGRGRLIRQLLAESVVLFTLGGLGGTVLSLYGTRLLQRIDLPVAMPMSLDFSPDFRALAFTLITALVTGIGFGLAPALRGSRMEIATTLRNDSAAAGQGRSRLRNTLVIGQVAMSLLLLTVSGLFVRALDKGRRVDIGFDVQHVSAASYDIGTAGYDSTRGRQFYRDLCARLAAIPGVQSVGYARMLPLSMNSSGTDISILGMTIPHSRNGNEFPMLDNVVDEGYFSATRMPIVAGRTFAPSDDEHAARVVIINEAFAKKYWPNQPAVGHVITLDSAAMTIVGVVHDAKYSRLDEPRGAFMFLPIAQHWRSDVNLLVRSSMDDAQIASVIRRETRALDANLPVPVVTTLQQATAVVLLPQRVAVLVTGVLGIAGLALAGIGLYGVISFSTAQRTREIGVRVALGAARRDVLRLVVGEGMTLVVIGMSIGLALALGATRALTSFLFGVSPLDGLTFVAVALILGAAAFLASYLPARRAASVDPMLALRHE